MIKTLVVWYFNVRMCRVFLLLNYIRIRITRYRNDIRIPKNPTNAMSLVGFCCHCKQFRPGPLPLLYILQRRWVLCKNQQKCVCVSSKPCRTKQLITPEDERLEPWDFPGPKKEKSSEPNHHDFRFYVNFQGCRWVFFWLCCVIVD